MSALSRAAGLAAAPMLVPLVLTFAWLSAPPPAGAQASTPGREATVPTTPIPERGVTVSSTPMPERGAAVPSSMAPGAVSVVGAVRPDADQSLLGVNVDLVDAPERAVVQSAARLAAAGIRVVRLPIRWSAIESEPGVFDWTALDMVVDTFDEADIGVLLTVVSSPAWSRHDPTPEPHLYVCTDVEAVSEAHADAAPPTEASDLAAFAAALAGRYEGRLWALEVWSEPNLLPNWRRTGPDPEDYAAMLEETAAAVRDVDPEVLVVSGALAPTTDVGVCYMSDVVFLDRVARTGALEHVDGVGIAPFGLRAGPEYGDASALGFGRATALHDVLDNQGIGRPLWALAWGWNGLPPNWSGAPSPWGDHGEQTSADWLGSAYARARADWPWMGPMFVWHDRPAAASDDPAWGFALVAPDGRETERWRAVAALARGEMPAVAQSQESDAPSSPSRIVLAALASAVAVLAAIVLRRWAAAPLARLIEGVPGTGMPRLLFLYAGLVLVSAFVPGPWVWLAIPLLVLLAASAPSVAIAAVAASAPFNHVVHLHVGSTPVWPVELLVAIAVVGRLLSWYARPAGLVTGLHALWSAVRSRVTALDILVLALVVWAGLSPLWAEQVTPALREWRTVVVEPALLYTLIRAAPRRRRAAYHAVDGLVLGAVGASIWALVGVGLHVAGSSGMAVAAEGVVRATGPYASPNNLALFLGRMLPVLAAFVVWGGGGRRRWYAVASAPILVALLLTFSRGALVFGVPATVLYLVIVGLALERATNWRRVASAAAGAVTALVILVLPFARTERIRSTFSLEPGSTAFLRLRLWQSASDMARDHPWLGVGLDNFLYLFRDRYVARDAAQERFLSHPHNAVLDWWTRLGVPGLLLFVGLVWGNLRAGIRAISGDPACRALAIAALGMQVYAVAHGMVDNVFFLVDLAVVWWIAQAALLNIVEDRRADRSQDQTKK